MNAEPLNPIIIITCLIALQEIDRVKRIAGLESEKSKRLTLRYAGVIFKFTLIQPIVLIYADAKKNSSAKENPEPIARSRNKMADVISLDDKLELAKDKKAELIKRRKVLAVQKVFQCTQCVFKCEKCGIQISHNYHAGEKNKKKLKVPYRLCVSCSEEYTDYVNQNKVKGDPDSYWHNKSWLDLWKKWIDYQGAIDHYLKSKEFLLLLQELKQTRSDE